MAVTCCWSTVTRRPWADALAGRLNREWGAESPWGYTRPEDALPGAQFVVSAIEVPPRERLWRQDYEIPLRHGVRQPYAENGGPGGFAHAARNIGLLTYG